MATGRLGALARGIPRRAACLAIWLLLAGCSHRSATATLIMVPPGDATDAQVVETTRLLLGRFNGSKPSSSSSVSAVYEQGAIRFDFVGETRPAADIIYLGTTQGMYSVAASDGEERVWISDLDFVSANCVRENNRVYLDMQVTPAAGARLLELTRQNAGKVLETYWDRKVVQQTTISAVSGARFRSSLPQDNHADLMCTILKIGRLPISIMAYDFKLAGVESNIR